MKKFSNNKHLRNFMNEIAKGITFASQDDKKNVYLRLVEAEEKFRERLSKNPQSTRIYMLFISFIMAKNRNILTARPYFRVRSSYFTKNISPSLKNANIEKLKTFPINYKFVKFVYDNWNGSFPKTLNKLKTTIEQCREEIVKNDLPLVINRARIFYYKTPMSHLTFEDMIQIASEGLLIGIDKYTGKFGKTFNGVLIGRMVSCLLDEYNSTLIHFYPSDRNIIYNIANIKSKLKIEDNEKAIDIFNERRLEEGKDPIDPNYILDVLNAVSPISDTLYDKESKNDDFLTHNLSDISSNDTIDEEKVIEQKNTVKALYKIFREKCTILEKKYLVLADLVPYEELFGKT